MNEKPLCKPFRGTWLSLSHPFYAIAMGWRKLYFKSKRKIAALQAEAASHDRMIYDFLSDKRRLLEEAVLTQDRLLKMERELSRLEDIPLDRLQFPDGSVPTGTEACAKGWHDIAETALSENRRILNALKKVSELTHPSNGFCECKPVHDIVSATLNYKP